MTSRPGPWGRNDRPPFRGPSQPQARPRSLLSDEDARRIVRDGDAVLLVERAKELAGKLGVTATQLRRFFGEVKRIEMAWSQDPVRAKRRAVLLEPRLAYQVRRGIRGGEEFRATLEPLLRYARESEESFNRFVEFYEALIAYSPDQGGDRR